MNFTHFKLTAFFLIFGMFFCGNMGYAVTLDNIQNGSTGNTYSDRIDAPIVKPAFLPKFDTSESPSYSAAQSVIYKVINIILFLAGTVAVIVIIIGGFMYTVNAGVENIQKKAKNTIINAIFGLLVIFLSYAIVENTVKYLYQKQEQQKYQEVQKLEQKDVVEQPATPAPAATTTPQ